MEKLEKVKQFQWVGPKDFKATDILEKEMYTEFLIYFMFIYLLIYL